MTTAIRSSWLIGAFELSAPVTIVVDGGNNAVIPAGEYYLTDPTPALSLIDVVLGAVTPHMTTPAMFIGEDRKIRVTAGALFTWAIPPELADVLGFGLSVPSTTSATAAAVSSLLWSPGWPETTIGHPTGTTGWEEPTRVVTTSASGRTMRTTLTGTSAVRTGLSWNFVRRARAWAEGNDDGEPGDFRRFWVDVLNPGRRWKLYTMVLEDNASSTAAVLASPFGPYKAPKLTNEWWRRSIKAADTHSDIRFDGMLTSELT